MDIRENEQNQNVVAGGVIAFDKQTTDDRSITRSSVIQTGVNLFFSFDLVNSTKYKQLVEEWPFVIKELLNCIKAHVENNPYLHNCVLWRIIGDEIVYVYSASSKQLLTELVDEIFTELNAVVNMLQNGKFFDDMVTQGIKPEQIEKLKRQNILSVKATAWIAVVNEKSKDPYDNIMYIFEAAGRGDILEFQGADIDAGFRLKEHTYRGRLCVSFELAYFLKENGQDKNLRIMEYRSLKGVWNDELYPIIWYHNSKTAVGTYPNLRHNDGNDQNEEGDNFIESFRYNDFFEYPAIKNYLQHSPLNISHSKDESLVYSADQALDKIIQDRGMRKKIDYIIKTFSAKSGIEYGVQERYYQLHCAVVCCDVENRKALIAKRTMTHVTNYGRWEFGCAHARGDQSLIETITVHYKEAFGIDIKLCLDDRRKDKQPIPIAVYELKKDEEVKKGIIFVASVEHPEATRDFRKGLYHDEIRWISEGQIGDYSEKDTVQDFHDTLRKVFERFDSFFKKGEAG